MHLYAIIKNNVVIDIVESESEIVPSALCFLLPQNFDDIVKITKLTGDAYLNEGYQDGRFMMPQPYKSWIFNKITWNWEPPISYPNPNKPYNWNEITKSWDEVII